MARGLTKTSAARPIGRSTSLMLGLGMPPEARADDAYAKTQLKVMSDYLAAQKAISFGYDANYEIVTKDQQKLALASSGTIDAQPARQGPRHALRRVCGCRDAL